MPFIKMDADAYDEMLEELGEEVISGPRPSGEFEYQTVEGKFKTSKLSAQARLIADALRAAGATTFRIAYDGGYDEGFSHPETITINGKPTDPAAVVKQITTPALVTALREEYKKQKWSAESAATSADAEIVRDAFDMLAYEIASVLLGDGFGTGEYQLYGALTADLKTGQVTDDENAEKPSSMDSID